DAINLPLRQNLLQLLVELLGGSKVMPEGLFHDDTHPASVFLLRQAAQAQHLDDHREETRRYRKIKKPVTESVVFFVCFGNLLFETLIRIRILEVTFDVVNALAHGVEKFRIDRRSGKLGSLLHEILSETFRREVIDGKADDRKLLGKKFFLS